MEPTSNTLSSSRRNVLAGGAAAAAALIAASCTAPAPAPPTTTRPTTTTTVPRGPLLPAWPSSWPQPAVWHAAKRLSYGPTPALVDRIASAGVTGWIDQQLNHTAIADAAADAAANAFTYSRGTAAEIDARGEEWRVVVELSAATIVRAIQSERQLFERTVAFFWDALNVDTNLDGARAHCPSYDSDVIRAHTFGRFSDMLVASAKSGAMLLYLDQATSRADGGRVPNENYARELMELHTVGVDGGYSEADVKAVAYLLSGWSLTSSTGTFTFRAERHNLGPFASSTFKVLGWARGSLTGVAAGEAFIRHLAQHPTTAKRLAHKMAIRFIGEHVASTDPVVTAATNAYLANGTAIKPMLRVLLTSAAFAEARDRRIRRPVDLLAAAARASGVAPFNTASVDQAKWNFNWILGPLGGMPHQWSPPNGYPDRDNYWVNVGALIGRWNLATHVGGGGLPGFTVNWATINQWSAANTVGDWVDAAARRCGVPLDTAGRDRILAAVGRSATRPINPTNDRWVFPEVLALLMQQPQFQTQ